MRCSPSMTRWAWNPKNHLTSLAPERRRYGEARGIGCLIASRRAGTASLASITSCRGLSFAIARPVRQPACPLREEATRARPEPERRRRADDAKRSLGYEPTIRRWFSGEKNSGIETVPAIVPRKRFAST
jgi:hypothetical protein